MVQVEGENNSQQKRWGVIALAGFITGMVVILLTLEISHRNIIPFVTAQEHYIVSMEIAVFGVFTIERLVRLMISKPSLQDPNLLNSATRLRLIVRLIGYIIIFVGIISVIQSNSALAISIGTVAGFAIAFAVQNIMSSVLAAMLILNTHMIRVGEVITVSGITGTIVDINVMHTIIQIENDIVYVPNSVIVSSAVKRKKRAGSEW